MRHYILLVISFFIFFIPISCMAKFDTFTRTFENPLVPDDVIVSDENINDILHTPAVSSTNKIYDFAEVLTDNEEEKIYNKINSFIDKSNIDVAVVTTNNLFGYQIDDYAYNFYDYNDFLNDGVVFVIYVGDDEPYIYMGNSGNDDSKVFSIYTDEVIQSILEYVYKDINNQDYEKALDDYVTILDGFFEKSDFASKKRQDIKTFPIFEISILSFSLSFLIIIILISRLNKSTQLAPVNFFANKIDSSTMYVKTLRDELFDTSLKKK